MRWKQVLDIGCGDGKVSAELARQVPTRPGRARGIRGPGDLQR